MYETKIQGISETKQKYSFGICRFNNNFGYCCWLLFWSVWLP